MVIACVIAASMLESVNKEEEDFEKQYNDWLMQYNTWKEQNKRKIFYHLTAVQLLSICKICNILSCFPQNSSSGEGS